MPSVAKTNSHPHKTRPRFDLRFKDEEQRRLVMRAVKSVAKTNSHPHKTRPRFDLRFKDEEQRRLVMRAVKVSGLSLNAWVVQVTIKAARAQLKQ